MARYNFGDVGPDSFRWDIEKVQADLRTLGILVKVDGVYGPETRAGVARFQASNGLPSTGEADSLTVSTLGQKAIDKVIADAGGNVKTADFVEPTIITAQPPPAPRGKVPWWLVAGGALVAWKVLTR